MAGTAASKASESLLSERHSFTATKINSTMMPGFAMQAFQNGQLCPLHSKRPTNLEAIRTRFAASRGTPSPTESVHEAYVWKTASGINKDTTIHEMNRTLLKENPKQGCNSAFKLACTGIPKDVGFNNCLPIPQPDFVEGLQMQEFYPFPVSEYISGAVVCWR